MEITKINFETFLRNENINDAERQVLYSLMAMFIRFGYVNMAIQEAVRPHYSFFDGFGLDRDLANLLIANFRQGAYQFPFGTMTIENGMITHTEAINQNVM